jgi:hypothetical protein
LINVAIRCDQRYHETLIFDWLRIASSDASTSFASQQWLLLKYYKKKKNTKNRGDLTVVPGF